MSGTGPHSGDEPFLLSDVKIKFGGHQLFGHKVVLVRRSRYFLRAFTGAFPVASSSEIDLGDDEDPGAIRAMIRHIYELPYDKMLEGDTADDTAAYSINEDLLFHIVVFTAADKYDVASFRPLVVSQFEGLVETNWEGEEFATSIQKLTGPSAGHLADNTLQAAAAAFCAKNLTELIKKDAFVKMIQEEEPFTGRLLGGFFNEHALTPSELGVRVMACPRCTNTVRANLQDHFNTCVGCHDRCSQDYGMTSIGLIKRL
ncbi:hypothetical protein E4T38_06358 [Aureobasidium subglaciale]|nr:hypothetical protein E4T38_06358 [Aureobasidium subglaciale]KAI5219529.1 hypothetical protein E4T40_06390 [Aureobasidium subglaciale]KAI5223199.1 hypothetical protein E4T41_06230 [Aureobasidium subglaciale]KAI5259761.1 hypothetical protein E4T46_06665 [Aureobasidium subglaciale]